MDPIAELREAVRLGEDGKVSEAKGRLHSLSEHLTQRPDALAECVLAHHLADLQDEFRLTYVFISHDLSVVRYIADEVMVMYLGEVVEQGTRDAVFANPQHPYTRQLFAATPRADVAHIKARLARRAEAVSA